jgi:hypothetical protein
MKILPKKMYAVARIATCPNAVQFDPNRVAFTDTATMFAPRSDLIRFPFDLVFVSRIYRYYYALSCRMSYLNLYRGDIYPTNLRLLPWSEELGLQSERIESLRNSLVSACETAFKTNIAMFAELDTLPLRSLSEVVRDSKGTKLSWSESFTKGTEKIEIAETVPLLATEEGKRLQVSQYMFDWLEITSDEISASLLVALLARSGELVGREDILKMRIPVDETSRNAFSKIVERFNTADHMVAIETVVDNLDAIVGPALGLETEDIAVIRKDMLEDPFLKNIVPRYPGTETRLHGYRTGLDSSERYD